MKDLVELTAKALVDNQDKVNVTEIEGEKTVVIELRVDPADLGKVIGKQGRIARSLRTLLTCSILSPIIAIISILHPLKGCFALVKYSVAHFLILFNFSLLTLSKGKILTCYALVISPPLPHSLLSPPAIREMFPVFLQIYPPLHFLYFPFIGRYQGSSSVKFHILRFRINAPAYTQAPQD